MLYLITHAHTQQKKETDATRWGLSDGGQAQVAVLARLPFWGEVDRIVLSSEPKTRLTVAPVLAGTKIPVTVDPRFDELRRGREWVGDYGTRVARVFANPGQSIGGWEAAGKAAARFLEGIHRLVLAYPQETLALVGHGLTFSLFRAHLLRQEQVSFTDWQRLSFCALAQVDWPGLTLVEDFLPVPGAPITNRGD